MKIYFNIKVIALALKGKPGPLENRLTALISFYIFKSSFHFYRIKVTVNVNCPDSE